MGISQLQMKVLLDDPRVWRMFQQDVHVGEAINEILAMSGYDQMLANLALAAESELGAKQLELENEDLREKIERASKLLEAYSDDMSSSAFSALVDALS